jgi:hypothetical protein
MKCCFCGPVRNCGPFLKKVLCNIEKLSAIFDDYRILIFYDHSTDDTLQKLKNYQKVNDKLIFYENKRIISPFRTHRIANARNFCLDYIYNNSDMNDYNYFIMMDFDDPNCKNCNSEILEKYLNRNDWDALSFNSSPGYYDIWGLSIYPFCFSYNHFNNNYQYHNIIRTFINKLLNKLKKGELLSCISSFNGFAIYRREKFINCKYDGRIRLDLFPKSYIISHSVAQKSKLVFKDYGHIKGKYEDCEHRAFHMEAIIKNNAKIMISPEIIFS